MYYTIFVVVPFIVLTTYIIYLLHELREERTYSSGLDKLLLLLSDAAANLAVTLVETELGGTVIDVQPERMVDLDGNPHDRNQDCSLLRCQPYVPVFLLDEVTEQVTLDWPALGASNQPHQKTTLCDVLGCRPQTTAYYNDLEDCDPEISIDYYLVDQA